MVIILDTSKQISEFLRQQYSVRASHARELAAAFLGFKSHAAYLALSAGQKWSLDSIDVLIPDLECLEQRLLTISNLPPLPNYRQLPQDIGDDLRLQKVFSGPVLIAKNLTELESVLDSSYLQENITLEDELSGEIAISNSWFGYEYYDTVKFEAGRSGVKVHATGVFDGEHDDESDRPNHGDKIDFEVDLELKLMAWGVGFRQTIAVSGELRSPY